MVFDLLRKAIIEGLVKCRIILFNVRGQLSKSGHVAIDMVGVKHFELANMDIESPSKPINRHSLALSSSFILVSSGILMKQFELNTHRWLINGAWPKTLS